jgi:hypothetical protein
MNSQQVLYQAKLAKEGRKLTWAGLAALVFWVGIGLVLCFAFDSFPSNTGALVVIGIGAVGIALLTARVFRLRRNPGDYRISMDDYGLYVHSDDPSSAPPFSVIAPELCRLVRKTIKRYESCDDYEYYVETKSGTRHRIEQLFADYDLDVMKMFARITDRFPWVEVHEEVQQ